MSQRDIAPVGAFTWNAQVKWWETAPIMIPLFEPEQMRISISGLSADANTPAPAPIIAALTAFMKLGPFALTQITDHVWRNYREIFEAVDADDMPEIDYPDQVWAHVQPGSVMVQQDEHGRAFVSIECNCNWEPEHGLSLVLLGGARWVRVAQMDGHDTDGSAYGAPVLDAWMDDPNAKLPIRTFDDMMAIKAAKPQ